ncbi:hypothetical protein EI94DRAFT_1799264 [Lactarius quietus]|nr:hypothetical protein EI94DRAFT_1799264 [Lactarius quietus]
MVEKWHWPHLTKSAAPKAVTHVNGPTQEFQQNGREMALAPSDQDGSCTCGPPHNISAASLPAPT